MSYAQGEAKLTGTPIGSPNVDYSTGRPSATVNTPACAFDGDLNTFYASYSRSNTWVGLDLGTPHVITKVGWCPRKGQPGRVQLGLFEASNSADFLDAVPLYLIPSGGREGVLEYATVTVSRGFRYVRYVGPNDVRCNIGELEFYGYEGEGTDESFYQITNLPTVSIHTYSGYDPMDKVNDLEANITITYDGGTRIQEYPITTRGRGNASWSFPKKPYRIKFNDGKGHHMLKDSPLESPAKSKKWTLINNYGDKTLMRNIVAFEMSRRLGMPYTVYCQPVDVIMNGEYKGCYQLCDQISVDKDRVNITEMEPEDVEEPNLTGGYLLELDAYANQETSWFTSSHSIPITIKSPGESEIVPAQSKYIKGYFNLLEQDLWGRNYKDPEEGYRRRLDVESFLKHFIVGEFSGNTDTYWSVYMYKNREDDQFFVSPCWDFDLAFDNDSRIYPVNDRSTWIYKSGGSCANGVSSFVSRILSDPYASDRLKQIWNSMRDEGLFTPASLVAYVDSMAQVLEASQKLNFTRWPILNTTVHQNPRTYGSYKGEVDVLRNYLPERISWIDRYLSYTPAPEYNDSTYYISTAQELMAFASDVNHGASGSTAYLLCNIDMQGTSDKFVPIGSGENPFHGLFDGNGFRISNLQVTGGNNLGLFGTVTGGADIRNFTFDSTCSVSGGSYVGVVGVSAGSGPVTLSCVGNEANMTGERNVAGIIGCNMGSSCQFTITDCYNAGTITGVLESASICGWIGSDGVIQNCWNIGSVEGYDAGNDMARGNMALVNSYSTFGQQSTSITMEQVASGELCYNLNGDDADNIVWYQTLGKDNYPIFDANHGKVFKAEDNTYYNIMDIAGDVNADGELTQADVDALAEHILDNTPEGFVLENADVNGDHQVDVYDIVALVARMKGVKPVEGAFTARLYAANTTVKAGGTRKVNATLSCAEYASAFQVDVQVDEDLQVDASTVKFGTMYAGSHVLQARQITPRLMRVLVYSPGNEVFSSKTGTALSFNIVGEATHSENRTLSFDKMHFATGNGLICNPDGVEYVVGFAKTYVSSILFPEEGIDVVLGEEMVLQPTILPELATNKQLKWTSSNPSIATVDQTGKVQALTMGSTTITAKSTDGSAITSTVQLNVVEDPEVAVMPLHSDFSQLTIYSVTGVRLQHISAPGLYLVNGKKVLIK